MTYSTQNNSTLFYAIVIGFALTLIGFAVLPASASAASYAYVASNGEVKSVVANDWRTAIATATGIHINSGVMLLKSASDFEIVGDDVPSI